VGSGDGKYFGVNPNITAIGCDRSIKLLEVSRDPSNETFCCDAVSLPFVSDMFDATVCIAVLHHLSTVERRYAVLSELVRITRPGGQIMIQAWALEQGEDSKKVFDTQDTMVPWKLNKRFLLQAEDGMVPVEVEPAVVSEVKGKGKKNKASYSTPEEEETTLTASELEQLTGHCKHVKEEKGGDLIFQRYCHVYKEGELENLCSSIPNCSIEETGWDKGNWFVRLAKTSDDRLLNSGVGRDTVIPVLKPRTVV
jgi:alkylated DNA repair protein alkB family protein 8